MKESIFWKLSAEFKLMNVADVKPNFAALGRKYGLDYRTVKKCYENDYKGKAKTRNKGSRLDRYRSTIEEKLTIPRITRKGVYEFLISKYSFDEVGSYSNFKAYCKKHNLKPSRKGESTGGHTLYETVAGELAQCDWKENISMKSRNGEEFVVNVFHLELKFSRYSYLELTLSKEQPVVFRCLINAFKFYGGIPKRILFDNMSTVMDTHVTPKRINSKMVQFSKNMGFDITSCKPRHAYTKGSNEARNKIIDWLRAFDSEFNDISDLIKTIETINDKMNIEICEGTNISPCILFSKEKEYLSPIVSTAVMDQYLEPAKVKVSPQQLVYYKGIKYSVDRKYINEYVQIEEFNDLLQIYYKGKLIQMHRLSQNPINYTEEHYAQSIHKVVKEENMDDIVRNNLQIMDQLLELRHVETNKGKACRSRADMLAYLVSYDSSSSQIRRCIESLSRDDKRILYDEIIKMISYIDNESVFFDIFKNIIKRTNDLKYVRAEFFIEQNMGMRDFLNEAGYKKIYEEFKGYIDNRIDELYEGWKE